jgi:outer membrane immunogenic protein
MASRPERHRASPHTTMSSLRFRPARFARLVRAPGSQVVTEGWNSMKYQAMIAAIVAGLMAAPAHAQDVSGFRIEGRLGWEQVGTDASLPNPDDDEDEEGDEFLTASDEGSDPSFGVELGYDALLGSSFVLGAYAGADLSDTEMCAELIDDDFACTSLERTFTAGARAGLAIGDTSLIYVKGGYSNGKFEATYDADVTDNDDDEPGAIEEFSGSEDGYHVGGGVELGLTESLYAKLEYVYTDYGRRTYRLEDMEAGDPGLDASSDRHQVVAGIGLRF